MLTRTKVLGLMIAALLILTSVPGPATAGAPVRGPALAVAPTTRTVEYEPSPLPAGEGPGVSTTTDAENVEFVGHIGGSTYAVAVQGDYAYIGVGPRLTILDISDPASPTVVGKTNPFPEVVQDVYVSGDYAYVAADSAGLRVVDVSTPANPTEVGCYDTPGLAESVAVAGDYAYVADAWGGLRVVDVSDPTNPTEVGCYDTPGYARGVAIAGGYAYVADSDGGLRVVDVSTPANPTEVGFYDTPGRALGVAVAGGYAYIADYGGDLRVVDVSTPANPTEVGCYDTPGYAYGVAVAGSYAYVAAGNAGLRVLDVSTPATPMEMGFYNTPGWARGVAVAGGYAYVADEGNGLRVVDVSNPANPAEVGFYDTPGDARGVAVAGGYAYIADGGGLRVVDVSDPTNPTEVGFYDTWWWSAEGVAVAGGYAYIAAGSDGLRVLDVSTPSNPTEVGFYYTPGYAYGVAVAGGYAYLVGNSGYPDYDGWLRVVDVSDPTNPTEVGFYDTPGDAVGVAVAGNYAYVTNWTAGLRVVDVSTPANPTEVGFYDTPGYARGVAVAGGYAYVADGRDGGLRVVDVSTPTNPTEVGFYDTPGYAYGVAVAGDYAYVADSGGLRVVDISTPANPTEVGFYDTPGFAVGVVVAGSYAYVADGDGGLLILRFTGGGPIDIGFLPNSDGYSFSNYGGSYPFTPAEYSIDEAIQMFGEDAVCRMIGGVCFPRFGAITWIARVNWVMNGGHCDGMASTTLRFFKGLDNPADFQAGANTPHDLQKDNVWRHIAYYFVEQMTDPVQAYKEQVRQNTPSAILDQLHSAMSGGAPDPTTLFVRQAGQGGHAITPYAIEDQGNGVYWVQVYDNNHPDDANRHVEINTTDDTWSYDLGWTTWSGISNTHSLGIVPISKYAEQPVCPWSNGTQTLSGSPSGQVWLTGQGHLLITDVQGRRVGYVTDQFVNEIPGAYGGIVDGGIGVEMEPIYTLPLSDTYTILLDGQTLTQTETVAVTQFGPGYAVSVDDVILGPASQDGLVIAPDGTQLAYQSGDAKEATLTLALDGASESNQFQVSGADVGAGQVVTLTADVGNGQLVFDNAQSAGGAYDLKVTRISTAGEQIFLHAALVISATDTHYVDYGAWDGSGPITVCTDYGSDGTTDDCSEVENQANRIYLPLVLRNH